VPSRRRNFGSVRRLPSGRWQASYWHQAVRFTADRTFRTKADAHAWLATTEVDLLRGAWVDPTGGRIPFGEYAQRWLAQRVDLRPRTAELYRSLLRRHLRPSFADVPIQSITTAAIRQWHAETAAVTPTTAAKAYRLLRAILATAVTDGLLVTNPCVVRNAGQERAPERQPPSLQLVWRIADDVGARYRAMVLTAALAGLRSGELVALQRRHVDLLRRTITVEQQAQTVVGRGLVTGPPKSAAGARTVAIPDALASILEDHLARWTGTEPTALVFTADLGGPVRSQHWSRRFRAAADAAGAPWLHFHDLRHLAGTLAAATGASTRELMARLGHSTPRAALIYQHATAERDHQIAHGIDGLLGAVNPDEQAPVVRIDRALSRRCDPPGRPGPHETSPAPGAGPTLPARTERRR
jgi:integrase